MAGSFLKRVVKEKKGEVEKSKKRLPMEKLLEIMLQLPPVRNFREALYRAGRISVIAEVKKKVPGAPSWKPRLQLQKLVASYEAGGAVALSIVTNEKHFGTKLSQIAELKKMSSLPVLCKDFIIDPYQVYEARAHQADALLLLPEILHKDLQRFIELTSGMGMTPVVEVHGLPELKLALKAGADCIMINNRDLNTLKVNMQTVDRLAKAIPRDNLVIAASGYKTAEDVGKIQSDRVTSALIGRTLISAKDPEALLREMRHKAERL